MWPLLLGCSSPVGILGMFLAQPQVSSWLAQVSPGSQPPGNKQWCLQQGYSWVHFGETDEKGTQIPVVKTEVAVKQQWGMPEGTAAMALMRLLDPSTAALPLGWLNLLTCGAPIIQMWHSYTPLRIFLVEHWTNSTAALHGNSLWFWLCPMCSFVSWSLNLNSSDFMSQGSEFWASILDPFHYSMSSSVQWWSKDLTSCWCHALEVLDSKTVNGVHSYFCKLPYVRHSITEQKTDAHCLKQQIHLTDTYRKPLHESDNVLRSQGPYWPLRVTCPFAFSFLISEVGRWTWQFKSHWAQGLSLLRAMTRLSQVLPKRGNRLYLGFNGQPL